MCPHIPLKERSQVRNVMLQKWRHKNGSTVSILTSQKNDICDMLKVQGFLAEHATRDLFHEQKSLVT